MATDVQWHCFGILCRALFFNNAQVIMPGLFVHNGLHYDVTEFFRKDSKPEIGMLHVLLA